MNITAVIQPSRDVSKNYRLQYVQKLIEDPYRQVEFWDQMMNINEKNVISMDNVFFRKNLNLQKQMWTVKMIGTGLQEKKHWMREMPSQWPQKVDVWAGIINGWIFRSNFIDGWTNSSIISSRWTWSNSSSYLPKFKHICLETIWYHQDGTILCRAFQMLFRRYISHQADWKKGLHRTACYITGSVTYRFFMGISVQQSVT